MTIRTKITLLSTCSVAVALAITMTVAVTTIAQATRNLILQSADRGVSQAETSLQIFQTNQIQLLHSLATDPDLWRDQGRWTSYALTKADTKIDPTKYSPSEGLIASRFQAIKDSVESVLQIEAGSLSGTYIMSPPGIKPAGYDPRKRPWYTIAVPGRAASTGARATTGGDLAISYVEPFASATASGVVSLTVSLKTLTNVSSQLRIGKNGFVMLFQPDGTVLTSLKDPSLVGKNVKTDNLSVFSGLSLDKDSEGKIRWLSADWDVLVRTSAMGWVFVAFVDPREYQDQIQGFLILMVVLSFAVMMLVVGVAAVISRNLSRPLTRVAAQLQKIAEGDFQQEITREALRAGGELGQLSKSLQVMVTALQDKMTILEGIAVGDLTMEVPMASERDRLGRSLRSMTESLQEMVSQIHVAVEQLTSGSGQIAMASQSMAQGAAEQASGMEEITASTTEVTSQARRSAETALQSSRLARQSKQEAEEGNLQMNGLVDLLARMVKSSEETKKIIKSIDDIAFQVNLLALNANIEAARAGKSGKGFAVVAEEVRHLAVRSAAAVQETTRLLEESLGSIQDVNSRAQKTHLQLEGIVNQSARIADLLDEISSSSQDQSRALGQISGGLEQIDSVTQANTASIEQSAAAAEQLSGQATALKNLVDRFQLKADAQR